MDELLRCRAMESLCRQRATFYPEDSWKWLAEAEMWNHKAFERCNRAEESNAAKSESSCVGEGAFSRRQLPSYRVSAIVGGAYVLNVAEETSLFAEAEPCASDVSRFVGHHVLRNQNRLRCVSPRRMLVHVKP